MSAPGVDLSGLDREEIAELAEKAERMRKAKKMDATGVRAGRLFRAPGPLGDDVTWAVSDLVSRRTQMTGHFECNVKSTIEVTVNGRAFQLLSTWAIFSAEEILSFERVEDES